MSLRDEYVDTNEAARLLGVTAQHVRRLGEQGEIPFPFRGLVDRSSMEQLKAAAYQTDSRDRDRHLYDAAVLLACIEDPTEALSARGRLRYVPVRD